MTRPVIGSPSAIYHCRERSAKRSKPHPRNSGPRQLDQTPLRPRGGDRKSQPGRCRGAKLISPPWLIYLTLCRSIARAQIHSVLTVVDLARPRREPSFRRPSGSPARWDRSSPEPASLTQQFTGLARAMSLSYSPSSPRGLPLEFSASPILGDLPRRRGGSSRESSGTFLRGVGGSPRGTPISGVARSPVS